MSLDITAIKILLKELNLRAASSSILQKKTGLGANAVRRWLKVLKSANLIYVSEWHQHFHAWTAYYEWNHSETSTDVPKPTALPADVLYERFKTARKIKRIVGRIKNAPADL